MLLKQMPIIIVLPGDIRSNEFQHLATMHTLWMREHNRIVHILKAINPHWDSERLFQETRKIIGALIQRLTYFEYLPVVLGDELMDKYGLRTQETGFFDGILFKSFSKDHNYMLPARAHFFLGLFVYWHRTMMIVIGI